MNGYCKIKTGIIVRLSLLDGEIKNKQFLKQMKENSTGSSKTKALSNVSIQSRSI